MSKPNIIILGGTGFIGRNFVKYLVENDLCGKIKVVDKQFPAVAYFSEELKAIFDRPNVEFKQGNLNNEMSIKKCFDDEEVSSWDVVFNLAAETKYGQTDEIYEEKVVDVAVKCGKEAKSRNIPKWIEISTAQVYKAQKKLSTESAPLKPWTKVAKSKLAAEEKLKEMGLPLVILRPAVVYGPADVSGVSPRIICAAVYKKLDEKMKFLWTKNLKLHSVHVVDMARAMWLAFEKAEPGSIYNISVGDSTQQSINVLLEEIFEIKTGFMGSVVSNLARTNMTSVTEDINEKHLKPWADLCKEHEILSTPLTPYLDQELLYNNALAIDGTKIVNDLGFQYNHPLMTTDLIRQQIDYYVKLNLFPNLW